MKINEICNEDCRETMKKMPNDVIDLVVTSPPYDNLRTYNKEIDKIWNEEIWKEIIKELYRVIKPGGIVVWVIGDATIKGSKSGTSFKQALYFKECGFRIHDTMIYQKTGCCMPSCNRYLANFEYMFVFSKDKPKTYNLICDRKNKYLTRWGKGRKVRNKDGTWSYRKNYEIKEYGRRFNIWQYNNGGQGYGGDKYSDMHPATFPEKLANDHIISWSNEGDLIYDPFAGSGTTIKMAKINNRKWIGSEINEEYCNIIEKRINDINNL